MRAINSLSQNRMTPEKRKLIILLFFVFTSPFFLNILSSFFTSIGEQGASYTSEFIAFKIDKSPDEINNSSVKNESKPPSEDTNTNQENNAKDTYIVVQKISDSEYLCLELNGNEIPFNNSKFIITSLENRDLFKIENVVKADSENK